MPVGDRVWTFPADGGLAPHAERGSESPYTPQERVGIREGATTGPYLYVWTQSRVAEPEPVDWLEDGTPIYPDGYVPQAALGRLVAGSLIEVGGKAVAVKVIDDAKVDGYVGDGNGWLLPVRQLKPGITYRATVVLAPSEGEDQRRHTHSWTFKTSPATLENGGYHYPPTRSQRKRCKRKQGLDRFLCLNGRESPVLR